MFWEYDYPRLCAKIKKIWKVNQTRNVELQAYTIGLCYLCYIIIIVVVVDDASAVVVATTAGVVMVIMLMVVKDKVGVSNKCEWEE